MKILFVAQNLAVGGIQTSLVNLLCKMSAQRKYEIDLFTFASGGLEKQIPKDVTVIKGKKLLSLAASPFDAIKSRGKFFDVILRVIITLFAKAAGSEKFYRLCFKMQRLDKVYDAAVSYFNDVPSGTFNKGTNLYVSDFVKAKEKTAWIHTDPILCGFNPGLCRNTYKTFNRIVCVSNAVKQKFDELIPDFSERTEVIYNCFCEEKIKNLAGEFVPFKNSRFNIVTVGRTDNASKRTDGIVRLCKRLKDDGITLFFWRLIGSGPDFENLKRLAEELNVLDVLVFEGEKENPYPYIKHADLFALYSAYEGFPMVIGEAMILGTPILTSRYAAAKEQIPLEFGTVAENDEDFYKTLKEIISSKTELRKSAEIRF